VAVPEKKILGSQTTSRGGRTSFLAMGRAREERKK
jgi:hypothetical protein